MSCVISKSCRKERVKKGLVSECQNPFIRSPSSPTAILKLPGQLTINAIFRFITSARKTQPIVLIADAQLTYSRRMYSFGCSCLSYFYSWNLSTNNNSVNNYNSVLSNGFTAILDFRPGSTV